MALVHIISEPSEPSEPAGGQDDSPTARLYARRPATDQVAIAHGFGIRITVKDNHLVISDGISSVRRNRSWPAIDRTLRRVIITGPKGYMSFDALKWCKEHNVSVAQFSIDTELVSHVVNGQCEASDVRRQVHAADSGMSATIARELISRKLRGQARNADGLLNDIAAAEKLNGWAERAMDIDYAQLEKLEGYAARTYFGAWTSKVAMSFDQSSRLRIPANWRKFSGRISITSSTTRKQNASDPVNALLNYAYTLGYTECRIACLSVGLDPRLGFMHGDRDNRDSLALDILEVLRPEIDCYVLSLVQQRTFAYRDFSEPYGFLPGTCRIVAPLTHEIAEQSYSWEPIAREAAELVKSIISGHDGRRSNNHMHNVTRASLEFRAQAVTVDEVLPDKLWPELQAILPVTRRAPSKAIDDRVILAGMIYMTKHGRPWAQIPQSLGVSDRTMKQRRRQWQISGHWTKIDAKVHELSMRL